MGAARMKLAATTIGNRVEAWAFSAGIARIVIAPMPKRTALVGR